MMTTTKAVPVFAHDVDYWKTGRTRTAEQWLTLAVGQIIQHGGKNILRADGEHEGKVSFMLTFELQGDRYKMVWPVLPLRGSMNTDENLKAARRQAATTLYHDVKARCVAAARYGTRFGFLQYRQLPNGQNISEIADPDLMAHAPEIMRGFAHPQLEHQP